MGEVGTEEGLVHSKCLASFLGEIRVLPTRYPFGPAAHLAGLGLAGVSRICAGPSPSPSPHLPSLCLPPDSPGILDLLAGFLPEPPN